MKFSISILSCENKEEALLKVNATDASFLHLDVMDGEFVPNYAYSFEEINRLCQKSTKMVDIHLMVNDPLSYIDNIVDFTNIYGITFHLEINRDIKALITKVKEKNIKCGIAIKPNTNIEKLLPYLNDIDNVLIMSVEPGFGGQEFISDVLTKIPFLKEQRSDINIMIDGGINDKTINYLKNNTINIVIVGSFVTTSTDFQSRIDLLK